MATANAVTNRTLGPTQDEAVTEAAATATVTTFTFGNTPIFAGTACALCARIAVPHVIYAVAAASGASSHGFTRAEAVAICVSACAPRTTKTRAVTAATAVEASSFFAFGIRTANVMVNADITGCALGTTAAAAAASADFGAFFVLKTTTAAATAFFAAETGSAIETTTAVAASDKAYELKTQKAASASTTVCALGTTRIPFEVTSVAPQSLGATTTAATMAVTIVATAVTDCRFDRTATAASGVTPSALGIALASAKAAIASSAEGIVTLAHGTTLAAAVTD